MLGSTSVAANAGAIIVWVFAVKEQLGESVATGSFAMLKAYIDESGIHKGADACVVAGYWAKKGPWRRLGKGWRSVLKQFKVPLEEFHAKDAVKKTGFFLSWSRERSADFLARLGQVTERSGIHAVCWAVFRNDFFSLTLAERKFLTGATWHAEKRKFISNGSPNKPYFTCFAECVKIVASYVPAADKVHFFFGCDRPTGEYAKTLFRYWRWRSRASKLLGASRPPAIPSPDKFGSILFPFAKDTPELQVADLFAYLTYSFMLEHQGMDLEQVILTEPVFSLVRNRKSDSDTQWRSAGLMRHIIRSSVPNFPQD
jgi:Protein of unknown function (DUF3800)